MTPAIPLARPTLAYASDTGNVTSLRPGRAHPGQDRSGRWLRNAAAGLCVLAAAAAAVSFTAQYRMVDATRHLPAIAALEAAIPDAAALVFACLGIALALHGRRALRARALNLASVGASVFMNAIAAAPGWRNLAIWAMPPSPTPWPATPSSRVVRTHHQHLNAALAADDGHPAGHPRRPDPVAAAPGPGPRLHPGRVPRLGPGRMPGRPRPPRPGGPAHRTAAKVRRRDQDVPLPFFGHRTARPSRLHPP